MTFYEKLKEDHGKAGEQFRDFSKETRDEIWDSKEEIYQFLKDRNNFNKLLSGEIGENLLSKYKFKTICENFEAICSFYYCQMLDAMRKDSLLNRKTEVELSDLKEHVLAKANNIFDEQNMKGEPVTVSLWHDVSMWKSDGYVRPMSYYKLSEERRVRYVLKSENRRLVYEILSLHSKERLSLWRAISNRYFAAAAFREGSALLDTKEACP